MSNNNTESSAVTITTVTVTVDDFRVVRIGAKQMTLAVYRQLQRKSIFKPDGCLVALPWGWVNYDRVSDESKPFIFSDEGVLYRDDVDLTAYYREPFIAEVQKKEWDHVHGGEIWTPAGKWGVATRKESAESAGDLDSMRFPSEGAGKVFLREWMESAAVLEAAPQLFIGI